MSTSGRRIVAVGLGAHTIVGKRAPTTAAAVRAGICRIAEHSYLVDRRYEPFMTAEAAWLGDLAASDDRMVALARPVLREVLEPMLTRGVAGGLRFGAHLGLPSPRPGLSRTEIESVAGELHASIESEVSPGSVELECFLEDHAAALTALALAERRLLDDELDACVVTAVDSFLCAPTLDALEAAGRLRSDDLPHGMVPGEAAGACLLLTARACARLGLRSRLDVGGIGLGQEPAGLGAAAVCTGAGLHQAFGGALAGLPDDSARVDFMLCDLNGEPYRADELAFALVRSADRFYRPGHFRTPADSWGDVGAATGALLLVLAACAWDSRYPPGPRVLLSTSAGSGPGRAAALVHQPAGASPSRFSWPPRSTSTG